MSNPDNSSKDAVQNPVGAVVDELDENKEAEIIGKCKDLLTKIESGFTGITKEIIKHLGKDFAVGTLKSLLECVICKEIIIRSVSRACMHSFCYHCLTIWLKSSYDCPMCRNECYLAVKNLLLDQFVDLFVGLTFTEDEKSERSSLIQQRSAPSTDATEEDAEVLRLIEQLALLDPSVDTTLVASNVCVLKARSILSQIFTSDQFKQLMGDDDYDKDIKLSIMQELFATFVDHLEYLKSVLKTFPPSLKARYITFPLPS